MDIPLYKGELDLLITCEHASHHIPEEYAYLFKGNESYLLTHRGWDPGALELASALAKAFKTPLIVGEVSRLLVELNRSLDHPKLFSPFIKGELKDEILNRYYFPYLEKVKKALEGKKKVIHLSVHSFTPTYEGRIRKADMGILYDPKIENERQFAGEWQKALKKALPNWVIGKNTPYRGTSDGLVTNLRPLFGERYLGIELEINQKHTPFDPIPMIRSLEKVL